jgi:20S proteasome alpha/beta subunit
VNKLLASAVWVTTCAFSAAGQATSNNTANVIRGTINVVLGNGNGMVVETDSMQTLKTSSGSRQLKEPAQKLFVLDDRTVCTIAGFGSINMPSAPDFNTSSPGIIALYKLETGDQLNSRPFTQKLRDLSFPFEFYLSTISNLSAVLQGQPRPGAFNFELLLAGYDSDGTPKIGFLNLKTTVKYDGEQKPILETHSDNILVDSVSSQLSYRITGWYDVAQTLLTGTANDSNDFFLKQYADSLRKDRGASLSLKDMMAIADGVIDKTAQKHPEVGGEHQVAILANGHILSVTHASYPAPTTPPARLTLMMEPVAINDSIAFAGSGFLCIRGHFEKTRVQLDGNYYYSSDFIDATVVYNGGPLNFPRSNHTLRSTLRLGPGANRKSREVQWLLKSFPWKQIA